MCVCLLGREGEVMSDVTSAGELQCVEEEIKVRERGSGECAWGAGFSMVEGGVGYAVYLLVLQETSAMHPLPDQ